MHHWRAQADYAAHKVPINRAADKAQLAAGLKNAMFVVEMMPKAALASVVYFTDAVVGPHVRDGMCYDGFVTELPDTDLSLSFVVLCETKDEHIDNAVFGYPSEQHLLRFLATISGGRCYVRPSLEDESNDPHLLHCGTSHIGRWRSASVGGGANSGDDSLADLTLLPMLEIAKAPLAQIICSRTSEIQTLTNRLLTAAADPLRAVVIDVKQRVGAQSLIQERVKRYRVAVPMHRLICARLREGFVLEQLLPIKSQEIGLAAIERLVFKANGVPYTQVRSRMLGSHCQRCAHRSVRRCAWESSGSRG